MSGFQSDCVFVIVPEYYDSENGYPLFTIWPGISYILKSDFYCGHDLDLAIEYANELNLTLGHDPSFVTRCMEIVIGLSQYKIYHA